ncbi:MAG TPA: glycosyltransferase family 4 protein [Bacteroidales bacterium]|nr:glycosyltransferase family 4 protein [Bacteroidales bacterium]
MRIVLVNHYAGSPETGMEFRPYYMASLWQQAGHEVLVVAASFSHLRSKQPVLHRRIEQQQLEGVNYIFVRTNTYQGNGLGRIRNMLSFTWALRFSAGTQILKFRPDIIIASSTYPYEIYPLRRLSKKSKAKLIFEVHDLWPLSPQLLGGYSKWHPFIFSLQLAENYACKHCDKVISLLPCTVEHLQSHGLDAVKWNYVPNGIIPDEVNTNVVLPMEHTSLFHKLKSEGAVLVGYAGSIGIANNIKMLVETHRLINNDKIHLIITGKGPEKEKIISSLTDEDKRFIHFLDAVPKTMVGSLLHQMDILVMVWNKSPLYRYGVSANKLFDYMMAARPVVQALEAGNDPVTESGCGITVEPDNREKLAEAIHSLCNLSPEERLQMGKLGQDYVRQNHDYRKLAAKCLEIFSS